jgi:hypothetical protein
MRVVRCLLSDERNEDLPWSQGREDLTGNRHTTTPVKTSHASPVETDHVAVGAPLRLTGVGLGEVVGWVGSAWTSRGTHGLGNGHAAEGG